MSRQQYAEDVDSLAMRQQSKKWRYYSLHPQEQGFLMTQARDLYNNY